MAITTIGIIAAFIAVVLGLIVAGIGARHLDNRLERQRIRTFVIRRPDRLDAGDLTGSSLGSFQRR